MRDPKISKTYVKSIDTNKVLRTLEDSEVESIGEAELFIIDRVSLEKIEAKMGETSKPLGLLRVLSGCTFNMYETSDEARSAFISQDNDRSLLIVQEF